MNKSKWISARLPIELYDAILQLSRQFNLPKSRILTLALHRFLKDSSLKGDEELQRLVKQYEISLLVSQLRRLHLWQCHLLKDGAYIREVASKYSYRDIPVEESRVLKKILAAREKAAHKLAKLLDEFLPNETLEPTIVDKPPFLKQERRKSRSDASTSNLPSAYKP